MRFIRVHGRVVPIKDGPSQAQRPKAKPTTVAQRAGAGFRVGSNAGLVPGAMLGAIHSPAFMASALGGTKGIGKGLAMGALKGAGIGALALGGLVAGVAAAAPSMSQKKVQKAKQESYLGTIVAGATVGVLGKAHGAKALAQAGKAVKSWSVGRKVIKRTGSNVIHVKFPKKP